ncbi:unnamed protein product [Meloidogyne enterolobii]|uniref:Uncharacterized protein n=1 Tax=Meloidogyne enterolobii TaxID=390850 RepID=A0ACB1AXL3_MELEN
MEIDLFFYCFHFSPSTLPQFSYKFFIIFFPKQKHHFRPILADVFTGDSFKNKINVLIFIYSFENKF